MTEASTGLMAVMSSLGPSGLLLCCPRAPLGVVAEGITACCPWQYRVRMEILIIFNGVYHSLVFVTVTICVIYNEYGYVCSLNVLNLVIYEYAYALNCACVRSYTYVGVFVSFSLF